MYSITVISLFLMVFITSGVMSSLKSFEDNQVVPDVIPVAPGSLIKVVYPSGYEVSEGNELYPRNVKDIPKVEWDAEPNSFYTLCMTDPDAPSRSNPIRREFLHWLVTNIPGNSVESGHIIAEYVGSGPPQGTNLHRYVFLIYKQKEKIEFSEHKITNRTREGRPKFSISRFADKYGLGYPVGGNYFQAQYDDYVPTLHKQFE